MKRKRTRYIAYDWSEVEINSLICAVEEKPELWLSTHSGYRNRVKKDAAWRDIVENVFANKIALTDITTKWNNLRVQYKSYSAKYKSMPSGSVRSNIVKWRFLDAMHFIGGNDLATETTISNLPLYEPNVSEYI